MNIIAKIPLFFSLFLITFLASDVNARGFGSGFGWGTFAGFATGVIASNAAASQQRPVVVYREPQVYHTVHTVQPVVAQPAVVTQPVIRKQVKYMEVPRQDSEQELALIRERKSLLKEENKRRELAIREKELELQIQKNKIKEQI